jgi:heptosyltransferase-1
LRIALIKTSSMGDVIHALPVVSDVRAAIPDAMVDWVVEESFAELPRLHPGVADVIPVAVRRWRRDWFSATARAERGRVRECLAARRYDLVLDLQGLVKSALVARWAPGPRAGFSWRCAREPLASLLYHRRHDVHMSRHAIERLRELAGAALGIPHDGPPVFGLRAPDPAAVGLEPPGGGRPAAVLLHATSRAEKQWPEAAWHVLIERLAAAGLAPVLPWGSDAERLAAQRLAARHPAAVVAPRMTLAQCAAMLGAADCVVGVDTGLTHLACALDVPTVALFAATPAWRFGPYWTDRAVGLGEAGRWPEPDEVMAALGRVGAFRRR